MSRATRHERKRGFRCLLLAGSLALLAACSSTRAPITTWDFGAPSAASAAKLSGTVLVLPVEAPAWLDSPAMLYRLSYADRAEARAYAASRWIAPPAELLTERLRAAIAAAGAAVLGPADGVRAGRTLRIELEQFDQLFDSPSSSRVELRLRATVIASGTLAAQRSFTVSVPAPSGDARGGALALAEAARRGVGEVVAWLAMLPQTRS
jgi:cholesterol transport system auxiliary component